MQLKEKLMLIQQLYGDRLEDANREENEITEYVREYFEKRIITSDEKNKGILLYNTFGDTTSYVIYEQDKVNNMLWTQVEEMDLGDYKTSIIEKFIQPKNTYNDMVGFMFLAKNNNVDFKMKDISEKKNVVGIFCETKSKSDIIKRINSILETPMYNDKNTSQVIEITEMKNNKKVVTQKSNGIYRSGLCAMIEILLRHMDKHSVDSKKWFFSKEEAIINSLIGIKK